MATKQHLSVQAVTDHLMNLSTSTTSESSCEESEDEQTADDQTPHRLAARKVAQKS